MRRATEAEDPGGRASGLHDEAIPQRYPSVVQPVVFRHPQSGRNCLLLSPSIIDRFLGMEEDESRALLGDLMAHMLQPKYVYRHHWRANDAILWDNIRFMHAAPGHRIDACAQHIAASILDLGTRKERDWKQVFAGGFLACL
jgi:taurine dioxygenase